MITVAATPPPAASAMVSKRTAQRISALDFTKGALVLIMVLYHWLNYFYGTQGDVYRYLRFLTPSFIFITGFLVSNIYLSKYEVTNPQLPKRLAVRGLKILGVFIALNLARFVLLPGATRAKLIADHSSIRNLFAFYIVGSNLGGGSDKTVSFTVLLPIAYLLILSAVFLLGTRVHRYFFHAACIMCLLGTLVSEAVGFQSINLELLSIGLLGMVLGFLPIQRINHAVAHKFLLLLAYVGYLAAITVWNVIYPLQVAGVCLSLMLLYLMGGPNSEPGKVRNPIVLLGKYSLFGYIVQIAILQVLHRGFQHLDLGLLVFPISFVAAVLLTYFAVVSADVARRKIPVADSLYKAVFA